MLSLIFALGMSCADINLSATSHHEWLSETGVPCTNSFKRGEHESPWTFSYTELSRGRSETVVLADPEAHDGRGLIRLNDFRLTYKGGDEYRTPTSFEAGYHYKDFVLKLRDDSTDDGSDDKNGRLNFIFALGMACANDHGNGVWYQEGFLHVVKLCTTSWEIGKRSGPWTFGFVILVRTHSDAYALTHDSYYDIANKRCRMHCDRTVRVIAAGKVNGLFLRREWIYGHWVIEGGLLFFRPEHTVYLSDFGELDGNGVQHLKNYRLMHQNKDEYKITPSIGMGYRYGDFTLMLRYYPWVKSTGDRYEGNGRYKTLTSLYSGPVLQAMVQFEF
jgi:hypothetical protein